MQLATLTSLLSIASVAVAFTVSENSIIPLTVGLKNAHPEAFAAFMVAPIYDLGPKLSSKRQAVPVDATPDPNRTVVTPENVFVLQCSDAGFQGDCISWGAPPGDCVNYSDFNSTQAFLDKYENQTSSLSTNTGGLCQFYKFIDCNNKGDDRGVSLSYNYNLGEETESYGGDYDNQISSWRC